MTTPRELGAFVIAIDTEGFIGTFLFKEEWKNIYLMRKSKAKENAYVMAPGDREWKIAHDRDKHGVVLDPVTSKQFKF